MDFCPFSSPVNLAVQRKVLVPPSPDSSKGMIKNPEAPAQTFLPLNGFHSQVLAFHLPVFPSVHLRAGLVLWKVWRSREQWIWTPKGRMEYLSLQLSTPFPIPIMLYSLFSICLLFLFEDQTSIELISLYFEVCVEPACGMWCYFNLCISLFPKSVQSGKEQSPVIAVNVTSLCIFKSQQCVCTLYVYRCTYTEAYI